jgi:hypothetical protein
LAVLVEIATSRDMSPGSGMSGRTPQTAAVSSQNRTIP